MEKNKIFLIFLCLFTLMFTLNIKESFANNRGVHGINKLENRSSVRKRRRAENREIVNMQNKSITENNNRKYNKKDSTFIYNGSNRK
jgi:hypothetical protein